MAELYGIVFVSGPVVFAISHANHYGPAASLQRQTIQCILDGFIETCRTTKRIKARLQCDVQQYVRMQSIARFSTIQPRFTIVGVYRKTQPGGIGGESIFTQDIGQRITVTVLNRNLAIQSFLIQKVDF